MKVRWDWEVETEWGTGTDKKNVGSLRKALKKIIRNFSQHGGESSQFPKPKKITLKSPKKSPIFLTTGSQKGGRSNVWEKFPNNPVFFYECVPNCHPPFFSERCYKR